MRGAVLCCIYIVSALLSRPAFGQSANRPVTVNFNQTPAVDAIKELEKQSGYFFYYDSLQLDSLRVTAAVSGAAFSNALASIFNNTGIYYAIDTNRTVFITLGRAVSLNMSYDTLTKLQETLTAGPSAAYRELARPDPARPQLYRIGSLTSSANGNELTVAGYIRDSKTAEPISGAVINVEGKNIRITTDQYGFYSLSLPRGRYKLQIESIGMDDETREIILQGPGNMDVDLRGRVTTLKHVVISTQKVGGIRSPQMGIQQIDIRTIKQVPVVFGEADVLRVVMATPGVKTIGEASTGLNVRGGSVDQNLILFNDATIFNPSHFFGLFSAFNPEVIKDVTLYKSNTPPQYGGRLSSVLEITSREGNKKDFAGSAGIGLLTSRFNIEGPIAREKASFVFGARTTYANWLMKLLPEEYKNSRANFNDINLNISWNLNKNNSLYFTGYYSGDRFNLNSDTVYNYGNQNISLKWKHTFSNKLNFTASTGIDDYTYRITSEKTPLAAYRLQFSLNQKYLKTLFTYYPDPKHVITWGVNGLLYNISPGTFNALGDQSLIIPKILQNEQALESAIFINDKFTVTPSLTVEGGVRYSVYNYLGPVTVNEYAPGVPVTENNLVTTKTYGKGKFVQQYAYPEYKISAAFSINENSSIKAGFNTANQYIHLLTNTMAVTPTDVWKLSDPNIKPQQGNQVSLGWYQNLKQNTVQVSLETYYKKITNYLDYKSGASLLLNSHIETDVFRTQGKSYGVELLVKKTAGKFNGWFSYTWSRILLKQSDTTVGEIINRGEYYPANYDKPHDFTAVTNYRINHRFSISFNATYSTGRPITIPIGRYFYSGSFRTLFADRNSHRIPDYFRTDISMNIEGNHKLTQKFHNSWTVGIYNITGRKNPYSVYYLSEDGAINGYKLSIFGNMIPFINYNIRF